MSATELLARRKARSRRLYLEIFGKGNLAAADEIMAPDIVSHGPGTPPTTGTDGIKRQALLLRGALPDLRVTCEDQVAEADRVVTRWSSTGTHTASLMLPGATVEPTDMTIAFSELRIDRYDGEHIVESWFIPDRYTAWQQFGLIPAPTPGPPPPATIEA